MFQMLSNPTNGELLLDQQHRIGLVRWPCCRIRVAADVLVLQAGSLIFPKDSSLHVPLVCLSWREQTDLIGS
jgi:hypothetical protein